MTGRTPDLGKVKLSDYAAAWIAERLGLRPRTADNYRWLLGKHIVPYLGGDAGRQAVDADDPRVAGQACSARGLGLDRRQGLPLLAGGPYDGH